MRYGRLGTTGLEVSAVALGCMSYGDSSRGGHPWVLGYDDSLPFFRQAWESGITFWDTANVYSGGSSEEFVGRAIRDLGIDRDEIVLATKVHGRMRPGSNGAGLSRRAILSEIDHSLRRLGVDHVDLYQIHRFDHSTPLEETLEALDDVVRAGKVRYLGASSMFAWELSKALHTQAAHGWARFVSMQDHYNLLMREEEREMFGLLADAGLGSIPWSPLARGRLARPADAATERSGSDEFGKRLYTTAAEADAAILDAVGQVADEVDATRAQVALAWVMRHPVAAVDLDLTDEQAARLEAPYTPRAAEGF
jgi:1-deoxyxylulose-5-phosphate synthase